MATIAKMKTDGNIRNIKLIENKKVPGKIGPPKIRLRLDEALENHEKARKSEAKYSLNPSKEIDILSNLANRNPQKTNYMSEETLNRNKLCQMNKIMFPDKTEKYPDERPGPRCLGDDSLSYLTRNRNSSLLLGSGHSEPFQEPFYSLRCPSNEATSNLEKGRGSRMMNVLQHSIDYKDIQPSARIRDEEATEIYKKNQTGSMGHLLNPSRNLQPADIREPRCPTAEARDTYERSQGRSMSSIMGKTASMDETANQISSKKRVKDEDGNDIDPHSSSGMSSVLCLSKEPYSDSVCQPRVKWEGEEIAQRNKGTLTHDIYNYNKNDPEPQAAPRVRPEAQEIADGCRGNATKNLFMKYGKLPGDSKPKAHITRNSMKIAQQSRGGAMRDAMCPPRQPHSKDRPRSAYK